MSRVAWSIITAQLCRSWCGETGPPPQRNAARTGSPDVLVEHLLEARARHRGALGVDEQLRRARAAPDGEPSSKVACRSFPERKAALAPPLAADHHAGRAPERDVLQKH